MLAWIFVLVAGYHVAVKMVDTMEWSAQLDQMQYVLNADICFLQYPLSSQVQRQYCVLPFDWSLTFRTLKKGCVTGLKNAISYPRSGQEKNVLTHRKHNMAGSFEVGFS